MVTQAIIDVLKPKTFNVIFSTEPKTYKKAVKDLGWLTAMQNEYNVLLVNKTWILTPLPNGATII